MAGFVAGHRDAYGVEPICRVLEIAPSTEPEARPDRSWRAHDCTTPGLRGPKMSNRCRPTQSAGRFEPDPAAIMSNFIQTAS